MGAQGINLCCGAVLRHFDGSLTTLSHNNNVAEGTTSNIFIIKNNELKTPEVNERCVIV